MLFLRQDVINRGYAMIKLFSLRYFPSLQDNEEFFQEIVDPKGAMSRVLNQLLTLGFYSFLYGVVMGSYITGSLRRSRRGSRCLSCFI